VLLIVLLGNLPWLQVQLMAFCGMIVVIMFGASQPLKSKTNRRMEFFNESLIMICVYHLFVFTHFVDDPLTRYQMGKYFIGFTAANLTVNLLMMVIGSIKPMIR